MRWSLAVLAWIFAAVAFSANHTHPGSLTPDKPVLYHVHGLSFSSDGKTILVPSHYGLAAYRDGSWSEVNGPTLSGWSRARTKAERGDRLPSGARSTSI